MKMAGRMQFIMLLGTWSDAMGDIAYFSPLHFHIKAIYRDRPVGLFRGLICFPDVVKCFFIKRRLSKSELLSKLSNDDFFTRVNVMSQPT